MNKQTKILIGVGVVGLIAYFIYSQSNKDQVFAKTNYNKNIFA